MNRNTTLLTVQLTTISPEDYIIFSRIVPTLEKVKEQMPGLDINVPRVSAEVYTRYRFSPKHLQIALTSQFHHRNQKTF